MSANAESQTPQQPGSKKGKRKGALLLLTLLFIIIAVAYGIYWFLVLRHYEETDDAYVAGNQVCLLYTSANDYVRTFFRGVDISQVFSAKDIARRSPVGLIRKTPGFGPRSALKLLQDEDREYGYVIERGNRFVGIVSIDSLKTALSAGQGIEAALIDAPLAVEAQTPLSDLLSHVGHAPCAVPVVDEEQQYIGIISKRMLLQALDREGVNHG